MALDFQLSSARGSIDYGIPFFLCHSRQGGIYHSSLRGSWEFVWDAGGNKVGRCFMSECYCARVEFQD